MAANITAGNAQYFAGGSLGISYSSNATNEDISYNPSSFSFGFSPCIGYWLNDKIAVGATASIGSSISKSMISDPDNQGMEIELERRTPHWRFSVLNRYKLWEKEKFTLFLSNSIGIDGSSTKEKTGTVTKKTVSTLSFVFVSVPALSYDLTEKFTLETHCDFLSLVISSRTSKSYTGRKFTNNQLNFNTNSTLFSSLSNISIGFTYKF